MPEDPERYLHVIDLLELLLSMIYFAHSSTALPVVLTPFVK